VRCTARRSVEDDGRYTEGRGPFQGSGIQSCGEPPPVDGAALGLLLDGMLSGGRQPCSGQSNDAQRQDDGVLPERWLLAVGVWSRVNTRPKPIRTAGSVREQGDALRSEDTVCVTQDASKSRAATNRGRVSVNDHTRTHLASGAWKRPSLLLLAHV
jgi:hypothetical protein